MNITKNLFSLRIFSGTLSEAVEVIENWVESNTSFKIVVTPNSDHICKLHNNEFKSIYEQANLILPDGMPLVYASKILKEPLTERVSGADLLPAILKSANEKSWTIGILGSSWELLGSFQQVLKQSYPNIKLGHCVAASKNFNPASEEAMDAAKVISLSKPDIVIVGLGFPKQEQWMFQFGSWTKAKVGLGLGAAIEFITQDKVRAPLWMQKNGLEWLHRMMSEPKRLGPRYLKNVYFLYVLLLEIIKKRKNK